MELTKQPQVLPGRAYGTDQPVLFGEVRVQLATEPDWTLLDMAMRDCINAVVSGEVADVVEPPELLQAERTLVLRAMHWAVCLQRCAGFPLFERGGVVTQRKRNEDSAQFGIVMPYTNAKAALMSLEWAVQSLRLLLETGDEASRQQAPKQLELTAQACILELRKLAPPGGNTFRFLEAAQRQGIPWRWLAGNIYEFGYAAAARWLDSSFTDQTSNLGSKLARNKNMGAMVLRGAGLPVPDHARAETPEQAEEIAGRLGYPVVVKPMDQDGGVAVAAGLRSAEAVRKAFAQAREHSARVLVEKHVEGRDYRLTVLHGKLIWAVLRVPGGVTGDGESSVSELLAAENADPRRGRRASSPLKTLDCDDEALDLLAEAGLSLDTVPTAGQFVRLRRAANVATGGAPEAVTDQVHPDNRLLAERAAAALRLDFAGIDLLIADISRSWLEIGGAICEVNAQPQLGTVTAAHLYGEILQQLLPGQGRIPLVMIVGDVLAEVSGVAVQRLLESQGLQVGRASNAGGWIGDTRILPAGHGFFVAGQALLGSPYVEAAVVVAGADEVLQHGLPFDRCDVLVLARGQLGNSPGGVGATPQANARFSQACSMALPHARAAVVINADDPLSLAQLDNWRGAPVIRSGSDPERLAADTLRALSRAGTAAAKERQRGAG